MSVKWHPPFVYNQKNNAVRFSSDSINTLNYNVGKNIIGAKVGVFTELCKFVVLNRMLWTNVQSVAMLYSYL